MTTETDFEQALLRLDRREETMRRRATIGAAVPLLIAAGVLVFLTVSVSSANRRLAEAQTELSAAQTKIVATERQLSELEAERAAVQRQTEVLSQESARLGASKEQLLREIAQLEAERARLLEQGKLYEQSRAEVRQSLTKLGASVRDPAEQKQLAAAFPITAVAAPKASAEKIAGSDKLYTFAAWLEVPKERAPEIARVRYRFDHPTFRVKELSSTDARRNYRVEYKGWGALTHVVITIELRDGREEQMPWNMHQAISWDATGGTAPKPAY